MADMILATQKNRAMDKWRAGLRARFGTVKAMPLGIVLYEGPSMLDGAPIVAIATGIKSRSGNMKTGDMVQVFILRQDMSPNEAQRKGTDGAVCGDCPHRSKAAGGSGACYVVTFQGPRSVWATWKRGRYAKVNSPALVSALFAGSVVRFGAYGDPAAVPLSVWQAVNRYTHAHTGYTHQWRKLGAAWQFLHASCDNATDYADAIGAGWGTFRVRTIGAPVFEGERECAAEERGIACTSCPFKCDGSASNRTTIVVHGANAGAVA